MVIASDFTLRPEEASQLENIEDILTTWGSDIMAEHPVVSNVSSVEEAIDALTVGAAAIIGMEEELGMIEKGRLADFAIFDENPLNLELKICSRIHAAMTVVGGQVVYDAEEDMMEEMYNILLTQHL